jgi:hypothetical protein
MIRTVGYILISPRDSRQGAQSRPPKRRQARRGRERAREEKREGGREGGRGGARTGTDHLPEDVPGRAKRVEVLPPRHGHDGSQDVRMRL